MQASKALRAAFDGDHRPAALALMGLVLGVAFGGASIGLLAFESIESRRLCAFVLLLSLFHIGEFFVTAVWHGDTVTASSSLLNHSWQFNLAMSVAILEYVVELLIYPSLKTVSWTYYVGFSLALGFQLLRSAAMWTAGRSFTHHLVMHKDPGHKLITEGVYSVLRHPSYTGWYWWSVSTQIVLSNPISVVLFMIAGYIFFADRVPDEEKALVNIFGMDYVRYAKGKPILIPRVVGVVDKLAADGR